MLQCPTGLLAELRGIIGLVMHCAVAVSEEYSIT